METRSRKKSAKRVKSNPSSSSSSSSIENLPNPVLMEILSRVPIKTLTASKRVCKSWLNLIRDPQFPHLHQSRAPIEVFFQPSHDEKDSSMKLYLGNFHFPNNILPCYFEFPKSCVRNYQHARKKLLFANSCNGLLCYYGRSDVKRFALVWNPCTSEFITFPPPELDEDLSTCFGYGLGFSSKLNKFKLLRLMGRRNDRSSSVDMAVADVCIIEKACSWKRIGTCSSHAWFRDYTNRPTDLHAVFFKGTLHWAVADARRPGNGVALHTFDFEDDRFGSVPLPFYIRGNLHPSHEDNLGVLGGCLFVAEHHKSRSVTVWLMKEYGVENSWRKLFSLGSSIDDVGLQMRCSHCLPLTYMDNGEILMKRTISWTSTVIVYNPVLKSARVMGSCPVTFRAIAYIPSIVMLKDSMLGYLVQRCHAVGLKGWKFSSALDWWKPVKKLAEEHGSGSYSSSQHTRSTDEWDQSESSADSVERAPSPVPEVRPQNQKAAKRKDKNKMLGETSNARVGEEREVHVSATSESLALEETSHNATSESSDSEEPTTDGGGRVGSSPNAIPNAMSESSDSEEPTTHGYDRVRSSDLEEPTTHGGGIVGSVSKEWEGRLCHVNKMSPPKVSLMLEMEKLKQREKELEHRDKELKHRDRILDQQEKLLSILQELDNTDQSRMTPSELDRHLSKIKRYENLVARTFDQ